LPRFKQVQRTPAECRVSVFVDSRFGHSADRYRIRTHSLPMFHKDIGLTIRHKQPKLAKAAKQ